MLASEDIRIGEGLAGRGKRSARSSAFYDAFGGRSVRFRHDRPMFLARSANETELNTIRCCPATAVISARSRLILQQHSERAVGETGNVNEWLSQGADWCARSVFPRIGTLAVTPD